MILKSCTLFFFSLFQNITEVNRAASWQIFPRPPSLGSIVYQFKIRHIIVNIWGAYPSVPSIFRHPLRLFGWKAFPKREMAHPKVVEGGGL